jgi:hypothetical protein
VGPGLDEGAGLAAWRGVELLDQAQRSPVGAQVDPHKLGTTIPLISRTKNERVNEGVEVVWIEDHDAQVLAAVMGSSRLIPLSSGHV